MIEGIATVVSTNHLQPQTAQTQFEGTPEMTPEAGKGKVNEVEKFENLSEESNPDNGNHSQHPSESDYDGGRIINLLG